MLIQKPYIRILVVILSMVLTAMSAYAFSLPGQPVTLGEAVIGAEAHIYHVYCDNIPQPMTVASGYGLVVASIKTNGYVTQALIFSAKLSVIEELCQHPSDLQYQRALVNVDNFTPARGGEIVYVK